jgi:hypothetical protein
MSAASPKHSMKEFARRGDAIYDGDLRSRLEPAHNGNFVAIDIDTGQYEVDASEIAASDRLRERLPNAQVWMKRVGAKYTRRFGPRGRTASI